MKRTKRMRLPNGFGQICYLKGNHRKPYRAMVTIGTNENGRPICKILKPQGYFETYNDAYYALMEYHKNPKVLTKITFGEIFQKWSEENYPRLQINSINSYNNSRHHLKEIQNISITEFKSKDIKELLMKDSISDSNVGLVKILLNQLYDYAVENEYVDKNYSRLTKIKNRTYKTIKGHKSFSKEEISILWKNISNRIVRMILFQCYTGMRPNELCNIKIENINLDNNTIVGGSKTEAGKNRIIPIHSSIKNFIDNSNEYLFTNTRGEKLDYRMYVNYFNKTLKELNIEKHSPHDCRKFFITTAKEFSLDEYAIKLIVGHHISDLTERIYTERSIDWLNSEIQKIKVYE